MKNMQKKLWNNQKKTKSSDPWARSGERPGWGHGSELFVFFVFPLFFAIWSKPRENQKKQKKKSSDPWARSGERPGWGHGSELFVSFLVFPLFFCSLAKTSRKPKKTKKTKSSDPWARSRERPGWGHGSELFVFFVFQLFFFHLLFACFSCEDAFITVPLKKCAFLEFAHLRPP